MQSKIFVFAIFLVMALSMFGCTQQNTNDNYNTQVQTNNNSNNSNTLDDEIVAPSNPAEDSNVISGEENQNQSPADEVASHLVVIDSTGFNPREITILKGETVVWRNDDNYANTVTSDNGTYLKSKNLMVGETYERTFDSTGSFAYHSAFKGIYRGAVYVK